MPAQVNPSTLARLRAAVDVTAGAGPGWSDRRLPADVAWVNTLDDALGLVLRSLPTR